MQGTQQAQVNDASSSIIVASRVGGAPGSHAMEFSLTNANRVAQATIAFKSANGLPSGSGGSVNALKDIETCTGDGEVLSWDTGSNDWTCTTVSSGGGSGSGGVVAWVNFDGRSASCPGGNCTIRDSLNVASVTRTGNGRYTLAFDSALDDTHYAIITGPTLSPAADTHNEYKIALNSAFSATTTGFSFVNQHSSAGGAFADSEYLYLAVISGSAGSGAADNLGNHLATMNLRLHSVSGGLPPPLTYGGGGGGGGPDTTDPVWQTAAGTVATINTGASLSTTVTATDNSGSVSYSKQSGDAWISVNSSTGELTGTARGSAGASSITVHAQDGAGNYVDRTFDVVVQASGPTGCPSIGNVCSDGSKFAWDTNMYVTDVNQSTSIAWSTEEIDTGADSDTDGAANQAWIVANETLSQYPAFECCENLNHHGHTDWYLPARTELNVLYTNRSAIGGFTTGYYWSSTEIDDDEARRQDFDDGAQGDFYKDSDNYDIRCVRRN